jgi:5-(aminomethyl)-3-furanmethanol phosphate kinase
MSLDAAVKIGGSLSRGKGLLKLCCEISRLGRRYSLLVVPGGGDFADQVRTAYRQYNLSETAAHYMAVLAMDQYGYLLNQLIAGSSLHLSLGLACRAAKSGKAAILLPSALIRRADPLPHSWEVTSDTIAAWVAHRARCRRLVLLKNVDGLMRENSRRDARPQLITEMSVAQLKKHAGGIDGYLPRYLSAAGLETWIVNGLHPKRLSVLLGNAHTIGTLIPSAKKPNRRPVPVKQW